jgi:asparagine synthase (glutamine-hydrolysing)
MYKFERKAVKGKSIMDVYKIKDPQHKQNVTPEDWFAAYSHLGSHYPYFLKGNNPYQFYTQISSALKNVPPEKRQIDPVGIIEFINSSYLYGNRTLVSGLLKTPWMGCPDNNGSMMYAQVPEHGCVRLPIEQIVHEFKEALRQEALQYLKGRKTIGILLSGGLDSRIVAGIIRELQLSGDFSGDVIALTWGLPECRDVIYAQEIARRYCWEWQHFILSAEILKENITIAGALGAEFSPLHLHALSKVRQLDGVDAVIAGSYGDSVGRAEFSGRHVLQLNPEIKGNLNRFGIIKNIVLQANKELVLNDAYSYRKYIKRKKEYQYWEMEKQIHYMRRKLQACMSYVAERIPLYQLFTAPKTFGFMWSLDVNLRDNRVYEGLLPTLPGNIGSLPWARTGRCLGSEGPSDQAAKLHHQYGLWLRRDLRSLVERLILSDSIKKLNIFNETALKLLIKIWPRSNTITTNSIDEIISWLASLAIFVEQYSIQPIETIPDSWRDKVNALSGFSYALIYQTVREKLRA